MYKPVFKKKEVVVAKPNQTVDIGATVTELVATVLYVGEEAEKYKVGDTILYIPSSGKEIKYFGEPLWKIEREDYIICQLIENESKPDSL